MQISEFKTRPRQAIQRLFESKKGGKKAFPSGGHLITVLEAGGRRSVPEGDKSKGSNNFGRHKQKHKQKRSANVSEKCNCWNKKESEKVIKTTSDLNGGLSYSQEWFLMSEYNN